MKKILLYLAAFVLSLASLSRLNAAINPAIVSADARWVVYADLNALRGSVVGKELISMGEKMQLDTGNGKAGIDWKKLLTTVGTATAYGTEISKEPGKMDGTLIVQGTDDLRKIAEGLLIQGNLSNPEEVTELTDLPFPAYGLKKKNAKDANASDVVIAFPPEKIIIISKSKSQIVKAREVFTGSAPSLAKSSSSPLSKYVEASANAFLFTASVIPAEKFFPEEGPQARILKLANSGSFAIGERGSNAFAHAELIASSDVMADKLMKILQGMTAMMSLVETSDKELANFLNSAVVKREGEQVTLDLSYASMDLVKMLSLLKQRSMAQPHDHSGSLLINGTALAEWQAEVSPAPAEGSSAKVVTRMVESVALKNGSLVTLGLQGNGGKGARFDRVEIAPSEGAGAPLVFRRDALRTTGPRNFWLQFAFPGADGNYTLKVSYVNDPEGKAKYAVSVREPKQQEAE